MKAEEYLKKQEINVDYYRLYFKALKESKGDKKVFYGLLTKYRQLLLDNKL